MRNSDESLLKSFALKRDDAAFRALVDRYLGLIFHTALRRTGNRPLAEEISQNILCALAKKAPSLAKNPDLLSAWLHRATLYESSKAMRSESSHQRRKQLQHPDAIPPTAAQESSPWSDAVPHLDVALDKLPEADRGILMLHYFEKHSFPSIARSLGKNPAAIQKQAQRALEKLSRLLRSRGVALSVTAVAAGLTSEFSKAAPAALLQYATTAVLSGTTTYSTNGLTLMMISKSKALIPLAVLLFSVPLILQQMAISKTQRLNAELRASLHLPERDRLDARTASLSNRKSSISTNIDILVLYDEQKEALRQGRLTQDAFETKLAALEPKTLVRLMKEAVDLRVNRDSMGELLDSLASALAKKDAELAVTIAMDLMKADRNVVHAFGNSEKIFDHFSTWAEGDTAGVKAWLTDLGNSAGFEDPSTLNNPATLNGAFTLEFRSRLVAAMILTGSPDLSEYLSAWPERERSFLVKQSISSLCRSGGEAAVSGCIAAIPVIREFITEVDRQETLVKIADNLGGLWTADDNYSTMKHFFEKANLAPEEKEIIAREKILRILNTRNVPYDPVLETRVIADAQSFLRTEIPEQADRILEEVRGIVNENVSRNAEKIIKKIQEKTEVSDGELAKELTEYNLRSQLSDAVKIAERIKDPVTRATVLEALNKQQ